MTTPAEFAVQHLPLSFADACEVVRRLLGPSYVVEDDGYGDEHRWLVRYREADGPSWDLPVLLVYKDSGFIEQRPWYEGAHLPNRMEPVSASA